MKYGSVDGVISEWVANKDLHLNTSYREEEVRSIDIVTPDGDRFQIWIDPPQGESVGVHVWDYKRRRADFESTPVSLLAALDVAYQTAMTWARSEIDGRRRK